MSTPKWTTVRSKKELQEFYLSILPRLRVVAKLCGYALGVHGSMRRDFDLIAVPWGPAQQLDKNVLATELHRAACGFTSSCYTWEKKPHGRMATCFPVCFPEDMEIQPSLGHIDLSVFEP